MLKHDGTVWLSTGLYRKETSWKNKELEWSDLVSRLQKPRQTDETLAQYQKLDKDQQGAIKDVGGFVGGPVTGGRRVKGSVGTRSLLTLDLDFAPPGFVAAFPLIYDCAAFIHGTHAHSKEKPRLRLLIPLARQVFADEYEAISRRVAGDLGIDYFDDTTFQVERLMYWPSIPKDVIYYSRLYDQDWLDPDQVLGRYHNWKDSSQWPLSSRAKEIPSRLKKQQDDPLEKRGIIGAFCRTFTIQEAIEEYLSDSYESTDDENRYTYMQGSAAKGLVVYEDKFAYSHHGTDPISGKLCNAFDLVRLHLFGGQDETAEKGTPTIKLPSFQAMTELARENENVRQENAIEKLERASEAFRELPEDEKKWISRLKVDANGNFLNTSGNVMLILENDPELKDCFQYDTFEDKPIVIKDLPWRTIKKSGEPLKDDDDSCLMNYLEQNYNITSPTKIKNAFIEHLIKHSVHPVRNYLNSLTWDGCKRIDTLLIDYFGAEDSKYVRTVTRKTLVGAVARVMKPGIKFDTVLTLISDEGKNKSTFLGLLGGVWFSADFGPLDNLKEAMQNLQGSWIIEIAELHAIKRTDMDIVKHFVSKNEDRFRQAYGKRVGFFPRQCIFIATGNKPEFLNEPGRHRRFWAVILKLTEPKKDVWIHLTPGEIRQIWAEAVELYKAKETLYLPIELEEEAIKIKDMHVLSDEREDFIFEYLEKLVPEDWHKMSAMERKEFLNDSFGEKKGEMKMDRVSVQQIWLDVFDGKKASTSHYNTKFIRETMDKAKGWKKHTIWLNGRTIRGWIRDQNVSVRLKDLL